MLILSALKSILKYCLPTKVKITVWVILSSIMLGSYHEEFVSESGAGHRPKLVKVHWYGKPVVYYKKENKPGVVYPGRLTLVLVFAWAATLFFMAAYQFLNMIVGTVRFRYKFAIWLVLIAISLSQFKQGKISIRDHKRHAKVVNIEWYGKPVVYYKIQAKPDISGVIYPDRLLTVFVFAWGLALYLLAIYMLLSKISSRVYLRYKILICLSLISIVLLQYREDTVTVKVSKNQTKELKVEWYGKPVVFYQKQNQPIVIYWGRLAFVLIFSWVITLGLLTIILLIDKKISRTNFVRRDKVFMLLVSLLTLPYLVVYALGGNFLVDAVVKRNEWQVRFLTQIGIGADRLSTDKIDFPLKEAAWNKDLAMVKKLVHLGANVKMENRFGDTALHSAAYRNAMHVARYLIKRGADVNAVGADGNSPLHRAHHVSMIKLLLDKGAKADQRNFNRRTAIFTDKESSGLSLLISRGASAKIKDKQGNTVLHYIHHARDVAILVKAGANVNHKNNLGQTPLHMLVPTDKSSLLIAPEMTSKLVKYGANPDLTDNRGMSPLYYTIKFCSPNSKNKSTIITGGILLKASAEARAQIRKRKLSGQLAVVVEQDKSNCWQKIRKIRSRLISK